MRFLPIIERELRVAARRRNTWWRRVLTTGGALLIFGFVLLTIGRYSSLSRMGLEVFDILSGFGMVYALLAGPIGAVDCLARERRDGTLGLLFLTDLHSYDVVVGKMGAASLDFVLTLVAAVPVVFLPVLLGGVTYAHFAGVMLGIATLTVFSLAVAVFASAFLSSGRAALGFTLLVLAGLTLAVPFFGDEVLGIGASSKFGAWLYMFCPLRTMTLLLDGARSSALHLWLNIGGLAGLAALCLLAACLRTARSWRDLPGSPLVLRWQERFARLRQGRPAARRAWRACLELNPIAWLEGRDRLQGRILWTLLLGASAVWVIEHLRDPQNWPDNDTVILWPLFGHYILCFWLAIQAPRRLADDKQSGALELLLCTPLTPRMLVRGAMSILRRRFGRPLWVMLGLDLLMLWVYFDVHRPGNPFTEDEFKLAICAMLVFPTQAYCLARVGLYQGLVQRSSVRATLMLLWKLGLLPWVSFLVFMLTLEFLRSTLRLWTISIHDTFIFGCWTAFHLGICVVFLAHAQWQFHWHFRRLAAAPALPWWKQFWQFIRLDVFDQPVAPCGTDYFTARMTHAGALAGNPPHAAKARRAPDAG